MELLPPAQYFPFLRGSYDINPNLKVLGTDYENGVHDRNVFQIDWEYHDFIDSKGKAIDGNPTRCVLSNQLSDEVIEATTDWIASRLREEHPEHFARDIDFFDCRLRGEFVLFNRDRTMLGRLMMNVQEDLAIVSFDGDRDWTSYLHVCSPSHWALESKIGKSFVSVHEPVPGFEKIVPASNGLVQAMIHKGPFVRFVWTLTDNRELNHHPAISQPSTFENGQFWVRTERQVMVGLPKVNAALFFIRVGFTPQEAIFGENLDALRSTLRSMSPEIRDYKGLTPGWAQIEKMLGL